MDENLEEQAQVQEQEVVQQEPVVEVQQPVTTYEQVINLDSIESLSGEIDALVQLMNENLVEQEAEKLAEEKEAEQDALSAKTLLEEKEQQTLLYQEQQESTDTFRQDVLSAIANLDAGIDSMNENILLVEETLASTELIHEATLPYDKQANELLIIFLCLVPLFLVVKWLSNMFSAAFR